MREPISRYQCVFDAAHAVLKLRCKELPNDVIIDIATSIALRSRDAFDGSAKEETR